MIEDTRRICVYDTLRDAEIWIDLDEHDIEEVEAIITEALNSEDDFKIYKHEGFGSFELDSLEEAYDLHDALKCELPDDLKTPEFFCGYRSYSKAIEALEERYLGTFSSIEEYIEDFLRDTGSFADVSEDLIRYFDFSSYARDLDLSGEVYFLECQDGVIVLSNNF